MTHCSGLKLFSIFQIEVQDYFINFERSNPIMESYKDSHGLRVWPPYMDNQILLVYEIRQFLEFFQKYLEILNWKIFTKFVFPTL